MRKDKRLAYGAGCTWFGSIREVSAGPELDGLPCCPLCGSMLFEMPDESEWWRGVDEFEKGTHPKATKAHPGYRAMWEWQKQNNLCFSGLAVLVAAYKKATGVEVDIQP